MALVPVNSVRGKSTGGYLAFVVVVRISVLMIRISAFFDLGELMEMSIKRLSFNDTATNNILLNLMIWSGGSRHSPICHSSEKDF